ncbi:flagellar protein FlaG [Sporolactobacillus sp. CPB3-1]|uniref:Flagellar protein FlaG n=1 Tax=Sporolactobacillus mangiferae TaxID=2940498 RepID=A0ABT0MBN5_9BACL|nr:flagellar protein FlaG [Sporolactobacillus mangiferae]MCL1632281.1 flagellar protein FlaG [Sporolactobacillus mangiferae]
MNEVSGAEAISNQITQQTFSGQNDVQIDQVTTGQEAIEDKKTERVYQPFKKEQLNELVSEANKALTEKQTNLHYVLHDKLHKYYVQIEDSVTHQVLREIPPKKFMDMYAAIAEKLGLIVNKRI